jgi:hypothetical protein
LAGACAAVLDYLNKKRTKYGHRENRREKMADLIQDVVSLVCMSTFLVTVAMLIGAL